MEHGSNGRIEGFEFKSSPMKSMKESVMFAKFLYRGLPTAVLYVALAFVQYYAIHAFA